MRDTSGAGAGLILAPIGFWMWQTGLLQTDYGPWFAATVLLLSGGLVMMVIELIVMRQSPYGSPEAAFERLPMAVSRLGLVTYVAAASFTWANFGYLQTLRTAAFHPFLHHWSSAAWVPLAAWALLLVSGLYSLVLGLRYIGAPPGPGKFISAVLWLAGAAALLFFRVFIPYGNGVVGDDITAAANFVLTWIYVSTILRNATELLVALGGRRRSARGAVEEEAKAARIPWITEENRARSFWRR